jgi:hypothetical protein
MSKTFKIKLIIISAIIAMGVALLIYISNKLEGLTETAIDKDYRIVFDTTHTVFIKASSWGLTGDHIQIQLSTFPIPTRAYDSSKNYIFYEPTIYYQKKKDTLIIFSPSLSDLPSQMDTSIKVIQVEIDDPQEMKRYQENYKSIGLTEVSIYK